MFKFSAIKVEGHPLEIKGPFHKVLYSIDPGEYIVEIKPRPVELESYKRHYFSQVDKLAKYAGYVSREENILFKKQLSEYFGYSITEIATIEDMKIRMEEMYKFSSEQYNYIFEPYNPE
jgi:hypothetical protein